MADSAAVWVVEAESVMESVETGVSVEDSETETVRDDVRTADSD